MKLLYSAASPYVRKVMVVLHETGQLEQTELISTATQPLATDDAIPSHNPLGKVPALQRDAGPAIYDSRVICRFLDDRAQAGLYPDARLWETLTLEATADGILDAAVLMVYESRCRDESIRSSDWVEAQWAKIARALDMLEDRWMSHLHGPLDMAQIAVGCALGYLDFRHGGRNWRDGHPSLAAWHTKFAERASMQATVPQG